MGAVTVRWIALCSGQNSFVCIWLQESEDDEPEEEEEETDEEESEDDVDGLAAGMAGLNTEGGGPRKRALIVGCSYRWVGTRACVK